MIHLAVWDPAIYKVRLKSKNGYAFSEKITVLGAKKVKFRVLN